MASLVVVTRPAPSGPALCELLQGNGWRAVWLPAFTLGPAPDPARVAQTLSRLTDFDLAVFVSSNAVRAVSGAFRQVWPVAVAIGVVGDATLRAVSSELPGAAAATLIAPASESDEGSEGLWAAWVARGVTARRVLILRAQSGREWLAETFAAAGSAVESLAVYRREFAKLDEMQRNAIKTAMALGQTPLTL
ncbi:MAG: uroporphyrinogen-III synthase, partial [Burkholderiaceae bacterium]